MSIASIPLEKPDSALHAALLDKINNKTKPLGALGQLETLALKIGLIQQRLDPQLHNPHILIFAGDHGIATEGVSAYPQEVTQQMVLNFLWGGAAINIFSKLHGIALQVVDAGVKHDFRGMPGIIHAKIGWGTRNYLHEPAMNEHQLQAALQKGVDLVNNVGLTDCNVVGFGEMGIGNTASASLIMSKICRIPVRECVGRGTGISDSSLKRKIELLEQAVKRHSPVQEPLEVLQTFGGFEIAMMCGAMLQAARRDMLILVDGFIASSAFLIAYALQPAIADYAVLCHESAEMGHQRMISQLGLRPLLQLDMRLGEGTGCALAYPLITASVAFLNEMASFESAGVSNKE